MAIAGGFAYLHFCSFGIRLVLFLCAWSKNPQSISHTSFYGWWAFANHSADSFIHYWEARKNSEKILAGLALGQAAILGSVISSIYKKFTGRIQPDFANPTLDISGDFNFGFLQHGIFWGWPSSHTTIAFAMAFTLITLYPKFKNLRYAALLYALYIGIAVSLSIHWFSEFIAGTIIGAVIGIVVGSDFRKKKLN